MHSYISQTNFLQNSCLNLLCAPYAEGCRNFGRALSFNPSTACKTEATCLPAHRFKHVICGVALWIPVIGAIIYVAYRFFSKGSSPASRVVEEERPQNPPQPKPSSSKAYCEAPPTKPTLLKEPRLIESEKPLSKDSPQCKLNIPCDLTITPTGWFKFEHMYNYFLSLEDQFGESFVSQSIDFLLEPGYLEPPLRIAVREHRSKRYLAYPFFINGNHWTLLFVDRQRRTFEYYDSKNGAPPRQLKEIMNRLPEVDPGDPYTFVSPIQTVLQPDGYQCGPWTCLFLAERLKNPDVNFNERNNHGKNSKMIAEYRKHVLQTISQRGLEVGTIQVDPNLERWDAEPTVSTEQDRKLQASIETLAQEKTSTQKKQAPIHITKEFSAKFANELASQLMTHQEKVWDTILKESPKIKLEQCQPDFEKMLDTLSNENETTHALPEMRVMLNQMMQSGMSTNRKIQLLADLMAVAHECKAGWFRIIQRHYQSICEPVDPKERFEHYLTTVTTEAFSNLQQPLQIHKKTQTMEVHINVCNAIRGLFVQDLGEERSHLLVSESDLKASKQGEYYGWWMGWLSQNGYTQGKDFSILWALFLREYTEEGLVATVLEKVNREDNNKLRHYLLEQLSTSDPEDEHLETYLSWNEKEGRDYLSEAAVKKFLTPQIVLIHQQRKRYQTQITLLETDFPKSPRFWKIVHDRQASMNQ